MPKKNTTMNVAKNVKKDEFYTTLSFIEDELIFYHEALKNKIVLLPCDSLNLDGDIQSDKTASQFWVYLHKNFKKIGLKKLIATKFNFNEPTYKYEYNGGNDEDILSCYETELEGNGDFRSGEIQDLFEYADVIITNPPFSLFREFLAQIMEYNKKFLIIGSNEACSYINVFKLLRDNKIWLGQNVTKGHTDFMVPSDYQLLTSAGFIDNEGFKYIHMSNIRWFTNIKTDVETPFWITKAKYYGNEDFYPKYVNLDAINVNKLKDIPMDYDKPMGVPITFFDKHNLKQFKVIGLCSGHLLKELEVGPLPQKFVDDYFLHGGKSKLSNKTMVIGLYDKDRAIIPFQRVIIKKV